jgi:uncharacterized protein involved in response to NO
MVAVETSRSGNTRFALFDYGFRPFFLLVGLQGAIMVPAWVAVMFGAIELLSQVTPLFWHAHQMVYGFAAAGLAGFMLTAVPNWTGAPALRGTPLGALVLIWLLGRIAMTTPGLMPATLAAGVDLAFIPALAIAVTRPLIASGKPRNLMLLLPLMLFWLGDGLMQAEFLGWVKDTAPTGARLGIDVMLLMIAVIGGRIVPTFTANSLRLAGEPVEPRRMPPINIGAIASVASLIVVEALTGPSTLTGLVASAAAVLNAIRLSGWCGERTLNSPILWVLHLGYGWLVAGLALKAAAALTDAVPESAALHALTVGAIGTMLLGVMSRAALGHTGRPLTAARAIVAAYVLISAAALLRVAAALSPTVYSPLLLASAAAWTLGFVLFLWIYAPILIGPRPDGRPG